MKIKRPTPARIRAILRSSFWFVFGACIGLFFFGSFVFIYFQHSYSNTVYPGVFIDGIDFKGKTQQEVKDFFARKNAAIGKTTYTFTSGDEIATISAAQLHAGYDNDLLANQAFSIGRSDNILTNISLIFQSYISGTNLSPAYSYSEETLNDTLNPIVEKIKVSPVDALFKFENGRVVTFQLSHEGQEVDKDAMQKMLLTQIIANTSVSKPQAILISLPIHILKPQTSTDEVNNMGIKELIGTGTSLFAGSIPNRIFNIKLAASRLNGALVPPQQVFSFDKTLGDISAFTGYKQAYVIQNGRTVLGDGGGVCQVSTTLFRAVLNSGMPIIERNAHAYRVHYYEEDSGPGIDAAVYTPTVDFKFKNDTDHYILIQATVDEEQERLTFEFYGAKDNREVTMKEPVIKSQTPAPEPAYQDDPTLPKGEVKQVDFAAAGASVYFTRTVKKDNKVIISDKFVSNFQPWQAVFLRGTKE